MRIFMKQKWAAKLFISLALVLLPLHSFGFVTPWMTVPVDQNGTMTGVKTVVDMSGGTVFEINSSGASLFINGGESGASILAVQSDTGRNLFLISGDGGAQITKVTSGASDILTPNLVLTHYESISPGANFAQSMDFRSVQVDGSIVTTGRIEVGKFDTLNNYRSDLTISVHGNSDLIPMLKLAQGNSIYLGTDLSDWGINILNGTFYEPISFAAQAGTDGHILSLSNTSDALIGNKSNLYFSAFTSYAGSDKAFMNIVAAIEAELVGSTANATRGDLIFLTSNGGWAAPIERMRIDYNGNIGIGTSMPNINTKLDVQGIGSFTGGASTFAVKTDNVDSGASLYVVGAGNDSGTTPAAIVNSDGQTDWAVLGDGTQSIRSGNTFFLDRTNSYGIWIGADGKAYIKDATSSRAIP